MNFRGRNILSSAFLLTLISSVFVFSAQQSTGTLRGQVKDQFGGIILGATVTVVDATGSQKTTTSKDDGTYSIGGLLPGKYTVRVNAAGFAEFQEADVEVTPGRSQPLDFTMQVAIEEQKVNVTAESPINTEPENNQSALVLRGTDIDALPDDPDDLADALQALAGPSAGPNGGQLFIDGFTGGRMPPKSSIREIRINQNPFSAEYDRLGFGRIEILTKPGTDRLRGQGYFNFNDEALNSRYPFALARAPYQSRLYGGNLGGPIIPKKLSFFLDFEKRDIDDNAVVNARILNLSDPLLPEAIFNQTVLTPRRRTTFSPRVDYQLNAANTLVARYSYERGSVENAGVDEFSLPERAYNTDNTEHTFQVTETAIINTKIVNETRFQFIHRRNESLGDNTLPTITVPSAFTSGGSQVGQSFNTENRWELQNNTSWSIGRHSIKAGVRFRDVRISDFSQNNFGGTFVFSSLDLYRQVLLHNPNVFPTQFTINAGNPQANVSQLDFGGYVQDDWRMRPSFTLSLGLRYENQTNISSNLNFAPRVAFAWSPGAGGNRQSKTVIRGGFGIFYDRFSESYTLQADRFNGENQQQFLIQKPTFFPTVPTIEALESMPGVAVGSQIIRQVSPTLTAPYTIQGVIGVERQLPYKTMLTVNFVASRTLHVLRSVNLNAPLPGTFDPQVRGSGIRPLGNIGNVYQYESSGIANQKQLIVSVRNQLNPRVSLFGSYILGKADSNSDGAGTFPANPYDFSGEYGRSSIDIRHRFFLGGSITAPWGVRFNPLISANTGRPFNITTGIDNNGDGVFSDRPSFAAADAPCTVNGAIRCTAFGKFNLNPLPGETLIPRNYGRSPGFFSVSLGASKTFGFGDVKQSVADAGAGARSGGDGSPRGGGGGRGGGGMGGFGGGGMGGGGRFGGGSSTEKRYNLTFTVRATNLLNTTNLNTPVGILTSPLFGQSNSTASAFGFGAGGNSQAGNRKLELGLRFAF